MAAFFSFAGLGALIFFCKKIVQLKKAEQPISNNMVFMAICSFLVMFSAMIFDPAKVLAVLLFPIAGLTLLGSLIVSIYLWITKKSVGKKALAIVLASLAVFMFTVGLIGSSEGPPPTDDKQLEDITQKPNEPSFEDPGQPNNEQEDPGKGGEVTDPEEGGEATDPEEEPSNHAPYQPSTPQGVVAVHFIDVGQGDSILILAPGKTVLIDGGPRSAGTTVVNYLNKQGIKTIDIVISTHPHEDHIGGLLSVLESFTVKEIIDPAVEHTSQTFEDYIDLISDKDIVFTEAKPGLTKDLGGGAQLKIISPHSPSYTDLNNASIVAKLVFGSTSFLFTGDAEQTAEQQIINSSYALSSTVLKIGHHGSEATSKAFLEKVNPTYAVICVGAGNSYKHPRQATLDKLKAANVDTYRTDLHGTIVISSDGTSITVKTTKSATAAAVFAGADKAEQKPEPKPEPKPQPKPEPKTPSKGQFVGSTKSDKYHYPKCSTAKKILPENEIWFKNAADAQSQGYKACGICKPPK